MTEKEQNRSCDAKTRQMPMHTDKIGAPLAFLVGFFVFLFETGSHYVAQAGLELSVLLPQPPECLDYRRAPCLAAAPLSAVGIVTSGELAASIFFFFWQ
jgi:hypothetical protein